MYTKLDRRQVLRDPLYGYITVDYKIIKDLIDSREFQRLRRIRQLAGVGMVFQTAEHSRFTHSLGVYHMANLVLQHVEGIEVLVLDDVATTGNTLHEAACALYEAGASKVLCCAVCGNRAVLNAESL